MHASTFPDRKDERHSSRCRTAGAFRVAMLRELSENTQRVSSGDTTCSSLPSIPTARGGRQWFLVMQSMKELSENKYEPQFLVIQCMLTPSR
jgi:hypothetical protein